MPIAEVNFTPPDECIEDNPAHCAFNDTVAISELVIDTRCSLGGSLLKQLSRIIHSPSCRFCSLVASQVIHIK